MFIKLVFAVMPALVVTGTNRGLILVEVCAEALHPLVSEQSLAVGAGHNGP